MNFSLKASIWCPIIVGNCCSLSETPWMSITLTFYGYWPVIGFLWIWHHVQPVCPTFISLVIPYIMNPESAMVWEIIEYPICIRSVAFRKERKKFFLVCNNSPYSFCGTFSLHSHTHKDTYPSWNVVFGMYFALLLLYSGMSHEKQQLWRKMFLELKTNNCEGVGKVISNTFSASFSKRDIHKKEVVISIKYWPFSKQNSNSDTPINGPKKGCLCVTVMWQQLDTYMYCLQKNR